MLRADLPAELGLALNSYCNSKKTVKIQCMISGVSFDVKTEFEKPILGYLVRVKQSNKFDGFIDNVCVVSQDGDELGMFHLVQQQDEFYLISSERAGIFKHIILKIFKHLYPKIIFSFIHSSSIYQILSDFETKHNVELMKKKSIEKQLFGTSPRTEISYETQKIGREYPKVKDAFEEAQMQDLWIEKIQVFSNTNKKIQFTISRRGGVSIEKGTFDTFFSTVLVPIIQQSKQKHKQFENRSRSEQSDKRPKPLIVRFGKDVFKAVETRQEFSKILNKYTNCNYSIIHNGNPHVYLSVLDRLDNSSFSVRTMGDSSLLLIPQIKTSAMSLLRFSEFLVSSFYEGDIQNYETQNS